MDEKNKVFVFDKKELFLIFAIMMLAAITSFAVGVRVGRTTALHSAGVIPKDQSTVQLKSVAEEKMEQVVHDNSDKQIENKQQNVDKTYQKLEEEFAKINQQVENPSAHQEAAATTTTTTEQQAVAAAPPPPPPPSAPALADSTGTTGTEAAAGSRAPSSAVTVLSPKGTVGGKYTIQLGSYPQESDAVKFADGFRIRGYNPILSEVRIPNKGIWYRVSLGTFASVVEAKDYISKEESLFQGQDYVITEFN